MSIPMVGQSQGATYVPLEGDEHQEEETPGLPVVAPLQVVVQAPAPAAPLAPANVQLLAPVPAPLAPPSCRRLVIRCTAVALAITGLVTASLFSANYFAEKNSIKSDDNPSGDYTAEDVNQQKNLALKIGIPTAALTIGLIAECVGSCLGRWSYGWGMD